MARSLALPFSPELVRELRVGDELLVSGRILTGRAPAHRLLAARDEPAVRAAAEGSLLYHCGPVVSRDAAGWHFLAAGPTDSARMEPWQAEVLARYGLRGILGKGGMGPRTLRALQEHGAVYLHATGGLAVVLARCVVRVCAVHLEELGTAEAVWEIEVADFPAVVTMDAHGNSLHEAAHAASPALARELHGPGTPRSA